MFSFLIGLFNGLNELLTLGGASALRQASSQYKQACEKYKGTYAEIQSCQTRIAHHAELIGVSLTSAKNVLLKAEGLLHRQFAGAVGSLQQPTVELFDDIQKFKSSFQQSLVGSRFLNLVGVGAGAATGGALSVGSWALVVSLGSASTGAAISSLSGVAASNAVLAWFGGGALAAGGAGMAGGSIVLVLVAMVPAMGLASWWTRRQAKQFEHKTQTVITETQRCEVALTEARISLQAIDKKRYEIVGFCNDFESKSVALFAVVLPMGALSRWKQALLRFLRRKSLKANQVDALEQLSTLAGVFLQKLEDNKLN